MVEIVETLEEMYAKADSLRGGGSVIGFVPTMGALHEGHLSLVRGARKECGTVVVSIFVNPTQFAPTEDYKAYPRDFQSDSMRAAEAGADLIFHPSVEEMYPSPSQTFVGTDSLSEVMCGRSRPGHFQAVATVVSKLFNITKPHRAYFGEKDYQQLMVVKRMVLDLNMDIVVVGMPTIREPNGLALSSRNVYLSPEERRSAAILYRSMKEARKKAASGEKDAASVIKMVKDMIESSPHTEIDYVVIVDPETLRDLKEIVGPARMALAVKVGKARLIDNMDLFPGTSCQA